MAEVRHTHGKKKIFKLSPPTSLTAMIKGPCSVVLLLESDEGLGDIQCGRKKTDRGGCSIRNKDKLREEERLKQLVCLK